MSSISATPNPRRPGTPRVCAVLLAAGAFLAPGCGLDDSALMECRCTPDTNAKLFPACPRFAEVIEREEGDLWVTAAGDTLDPATDWVTVQGDQVRYHEPSSVSPFATEVPECPKGVRLTLLEPTRPDWVIFNLRTIFEARPSARTLGQYMDQFHPDFVFEPDPQDALDHAYAFANPWTLDRERQFALAVLESGAVGQITISRWYRSAQDERVASEDQLTETFIFDYEGQMRIIVEGQTAETLFFAGEMTLEVVTPRLENPVWSIRRWSDQRDPFTRLSWGELRARFAG